METDGMAMVRWRSARLFALATVGKKRERGWAV
jgi:hypothetical protein